VETAKIDEEITKKERTLFKGTSQRIMMMMACTFNASCDRRSDPNIVYASCLSAVFFAVFFSWGALALIPQDGLWTANYSLCLVDFLFFEVVVKSLW